MFWRYWDFEDYIICIFLGVMALVVIAATMSIYQSSSHSSEAQERFFRQAASPEKPQPPVASLVGVSTVNAPRPKGRGI